MDILLINSIYFSKENILPQIGSVNLYNKLSKTYEVEIINFDYLYYKGDIKLFFARGNSSLLQIFFLTP
jgi:DNA/RNA-binding domain of Phe-tRNA-synthetase-like protein